MTSKHKSYNLSSQNGTYSVTITEYDESDRPLDGETKTFDNEREAQEYMDMADQNRTNANTDNVAPRTDNSGLAADNTPYEKPASQMTEADAVALNADVHVAIPDPNSDRVVTDGERDQVAAGLHDKPEKGEPLQQPDTNKS